MKNIISTILSINFICILGSVTAQQNPDAVNCSGAVPGCTTPSFDISTNNSQNIQDFGTGGVSNPTSNPNGAPGNSGCLLSGETTSTFITITAVSSGTLEWSIQGTQTGCFDWIMWPYNYPAGGGVSTTCGMLQNNQVAPVSCNWNGACGGFTGMANPGNLPAGASQSDFEYGINVVAGESYLLCLSNYSGTTQSVNLNFFGSANISCTPTTPDQTICENTSATVDIQTGGFVNPSFNWLVTTGVSNTSGGTGVIVSPPQTTTYYVEITENQPGPNFGYQAIDTFEIVVVPPPTPNAGVDQQVCFGTPISLTGVPSVATNVHSWTYIAPGIVPVPTVNFAPNTGSNTPTVNVNQVGNYYFIYRENNSICPTAYDTVLVTVSNLTIAASFVSPSCGGYSDGSITINSPAAVEYSFDGGATWVTNATQTGFAAGTYNVCGRSATGCQKCINVVVTDPIPIVVSVSNDTLICQNGTGYLSASATGGNNYNYHWDFTGNTAANQSANPIVDTYYSVYAESENGCLSTPDSIHVTVRDPLTGAITLGDTICPTYESDLAATVIGGLGTPYTFVWSTGDTQTGPALDSITVSPMETTNYTVTVTDECESTPLVMNVTVRVAPLPVPSYTILNPFQCEPAIFDIVNTTDTIMSQYIYWMVDGEQQFLNQDTIQTEELWGGQYDIQMIATSYEGCVDSITFTDAINVEYVPEANFNFSPSPVTMYNTNVFMQNQSYNASTFNWYFNEGYPLTSNQEHVQVHFPEGVTGDYEVTLIVASPLGCTDTITKIVSVQPEVIIYAPNTFTPDGDAFNQTWKVVMEGIDQYNFELTLMNRWGQVIWESHDLNVGWDGTFNGKPVQEGTYVWTVQTKNTNDDGKLTFNGHVTILR